MSRTHFATVKEYFELDQKELRSLLFASLLFGFIISFRKWGVVEFDIMSGLINLVSGTLIALFCLLLPLTVQKVTGLWVGHKVTFESWFNGWMIGIVLAFASVGYIWVFLPGGIVTKHLEGIRLGQFRYGTNFSTLGYIAYTGTLTNLLLAMIFFALQGISTNPLFHTVYATSLLFALYSLLPLPPLNGGLMVFGSREQYVFLTAATVIAALLMHVLSPVWAFVLAGVMGGGIWLWFLISYE